MNSSITSDSVYQVLKGCIYGGIWGMVTPFHPPGSIAAMEEAKSGIFKPARPFSSMASIGHNAAMFGSIMGIQRLSAKSLESIRLRQDLWNEIFGLGVTYGYYKFFFENSEKRLILHNRAFGGMLISSIIYGHLQTP